MIIGLNNSGKTTFARCFCGLHKKFARREYIEDKLMNNKECLKKSYMVMHEVNHQLFTGCVLDEIFLCMGDEDLELADEILKSLNLLQFKMLIQ